MFLKFASTNKGELARDIEHFTRTVYRILYRHKGVLVTDTGHSTLYKQREILARKRQTTKFVVMECDQMHTIITHVGMQESLLWPLVRFSLELVLLVLL